MSDYNLRSLSLPKLSGASLRAFAGALANPITRPLLMPSLLTQRCAEPRPTAGRAAHFPAPG